MSTDSALKRALDNYDKLAADYEALKQERDQLKKLLRKAFNKFKNSKYDYEFKEAWHGGLWEEFKAALKGK